MDTEFIQDEPNVYCITHTDMDGFASGSVVRYAMHPRYVRIWMTNYGREFDTSQIENGALVYITDFCLPIEQMQDLFRRCKLIWIDHHKSAIESAALAEFTPPGKYEIGTKSGCKLAWEYLFPDKPVPKCIELVSDYDTWQFIYPDTEAMVTGLQYEDMRPNNNEAYELWSQMLNGFNDPVDKFIKLGTTLLTYQRAKAKTLCEFGAFSCNVHGYSALVLNISGVNSKVFDYPVSQMKNKPDVLMTFGFTGSTGLWRYTIYALNPEVDVSKIAVEQGGGGHEGAAGFTRDVSVMHLVDVDGKPLITDAQAQSEVQGLLELHQDILKLPYQIGSDQIQPALVSEDRTLTGGINYATFLTEVAGLKCLMVNSYVANIATLEKIYFKYAGTFAKEGTDYGETVLAIGSFMLDKNQMWHLVMLPMLQDCGKAFTSIGLQKCDREYIGIVRELPFTCNKFWRFPKESKL